MPAIDAAVREVGAAPREIDAVIVSCGPGGFTGLRMAVAAAKAIALVTQCRLVALPSAVVAARSWQGTSREVLVALAGKGRDAWISRVSRMEDEGCRVIDAAIMDAAALEALVRRVETASMDERTARGGGVVMLADEFLPVELAACADRLGVAREPLSLSPRACMLEGLARLSGEQTDAVVTADALLPIYPREPEAVRLWRARAGTGAGPSAAPSAEASARAGAGPSAGPSAGPRLDADASRPA